jgi:hypothetical protein
VAPLALTQAQLDQVMLTARPIPPDLRERYLELVAQALAGRDVGDGEVYRACRSAAKVITWNVCKPDDPPDYEPRFNADSKLIRAPVEKGKRIDLLAEEHAEERRQAFDRLRMIDRVRTEAGKRLQALRGSVE